MRSEVVTEDLCVCGPMTRAQNYCDCGAEESQAELRYGGLNPGDSLERPYFDAEGNEGTLAEVYS